MAEDVLYAFIGMLHALTVYCFSEPEFSADRDLAVRFRLVGQQSRRHLAGVNHDERCVEQSSHPGNLGALRRVGNRMK